MPGIMGLSTRKQDVKANGAKYGVLVAGPSGEPVEYEIIEVAGYNEGYAMRYLDGDKVLEVVYVPRNYKFKAQDGILLVGKRLGNDSACPILSLGESVDVNCPGADLSAVGRADLFARGILSLSGKQPINWKVILIVVAVVAVVIVIYMIAR